MYRFFLIITFLSLSAYAINLSDFGDFSSRSVIENSLNLNHKKSDFKYAEILKEKKLTPDTKCLIKQVQENNIENVKLLLEAGVNPNISHNLEFPTYIASKKNNPHIKAVSCCTICQVLDEYSGIPDRIPTKIIKEPPFPIPFSVINSDIHITSAEPADNVITEET